MLRLNRCGCSSVLITLYIPYTNISTCTNQSGGNQLKSYQADSQSNSLVIKWSGRTQKLLVHSYPNIWLWLHYSRFTIYWYYYNRKLKFMGFFRYIHTCQKSKLLYTIIFVFFFNVTKIWFWTIIVDCKYKRWADKLMF